MNSPTTQVMEQEYIRSSPSPTIVAPHERGHPQDLRYSILEHRKALESSFNFLSPESIEESKVQKARAVLGMAVVDTPDEELLTYITQFQSLLEEWLDTYEQQLCNDKTLKQLLRER